MAVTMDVPRSSMAGPHVLIPLRALDQVMRLQRMGASFETRLSLVRQLLRRMHTERWRLNRAHFALDTEGCGAGVYTARGVNSD